MTREEYLSALKNEIMSLSADEQREALQFYSDYFEEAADDEKVISELGSPEQLAKTITEKFANAVVISDISNGSNGSDSKESCSGNGMYYSFEDSDVENLNLSFGIADVVLISGSKYSVETRGVAEGDLNCHLSGEGTLFISNTRRIPLNFFSHDRYERFIPRILITIPEDAMLNRFELRIGAGNFRGKNSRLKCSIGNIEVGAGNISINNIYGGEINFRCGIGNLDFTGAVTGRSDLDCGMGSLKLDIEGEKEDYSYDLKLGLGDFKINEEKQSGIYQSLNNPKKRNHFSVNCGMGSVKITINKS